MRDSSPARSEIDLTEVANNQSLVPPRPNVKPAPAMCGNHRTKVKPAPAACGNPWVKGKPAPAACGNPWFKVKPAPTACGTPWLKVKPGASAHEKAGFLAKNAILWAKTGYPSCNSPIAPPRPQPLHPSAHHALPRHPAATPSSLRVKLRCLCHVFVVAVTATTRCHRAARWRRACGNEVSRSLRSVVSGLHGAVLFSLTGR